MVSKMIGKIFITRTGYDPQLGRHIKDPYRHSQHRGVPSGLSQEAQAW